MCLDIKTAWSSIGEINYELKDVEKQEIKFRRSLYFIKDLNAGETITEDSIKSVRPGFGLSPKYFDDILGKTLLKDVKAFTPVLKELIRIED